MADAKFTVGQEVFLQSLQSRTPEPLRSATITKVGRKWVYVGDVSRFDPQGHRNSLLIDAGGYSPRTRVWLSREAYEDDKARTQAWQALRRAVADRNHYPAHLSAADPEQIAAMLKVPNADPA